MSDGEPSRKGRAGLVLRGSRTRRWLGAAALLALVGVPSAALAQGISGTIDVAPALVNAGDTTMVTYLVRNEGGTLPDVPILIALVDPDTGAWFTILCAGSRPHTATVSGGPQSFTLHPDADFLGNESCTVTVFASQVTHQDADDPPDNMSADFTWSFATLFPPRPIYEIQGVGASSPLVGTMTELTSVTMVETGAGAPLPAPVPITDRADDAEIDPDGINAFETLEGMLVAVDTPTVVGLRTCAGGSEAGLICRLQRYFTSFPSSVKFHAHEKQMLKMSTVSRGVQSMKPMGGVNLQQNSCPSIVRGNLPAGQSRTRTPGVDDRNVEVETSSGHVLVWSSVALSRQMSCMHELAVVS